MAISLTSLDFQELTPRIIVFGVGGAGGNAVNNMIDAGLQGVDFVVANTDSQALTRAKAARRIQIGINTTSGLGAGAQPQVGMAAAEESQEEILAQLGDANMVFITAGMGGGTGTGAAPVIARTAKEKGIVTVAVVTKPFHFEGTRRMRMAEAGIAELQKHVDTLIVIPNQNLFRVANERTTVQQAFSMADQVLNSGVRSITDLMVNPGIINLDFADVRNVMSEMGKAMMGTGEAEGDNRAMKAAAEAISNPLLDDVSLKGARAVLVNICGGPDLTLYEMDEASNHIRDQVDPDANIIIGSALDETLTGRVRVSVVATGIDATVRVEETAPRKPLFGAQPEQAGAAPQVVRTAPRPETMSAPAAQPASQPVAQPQPYAQQQPQPQPFAQPAPSSYGAATASAQAHLFAAVQPAPVEPEPAPESHYDTGAAQRAVHEARIAAGREQPQAQAWQEPQADVRSTTASPVNPRHNASWIFGRPKADPAPARAPEPARRAETEVFKNEYKDVEDIPAFLRRQAN
jgi:cell division protein FtsZ